MKYAWFIFSFAVFVVSIWMMVEKQQEGWLVSSFGWGCVVVVEIEKLMVKK